MIQTLSYSAEIKHADKIFQKTVDIYQSAVKFCIKVFEAEWSDISAIDAKNRGRFSFANKLIHSNKNNSAKYQEFDKLFYKMPSYLMAAVINAALGHLSSYHSELDNWMNLSDGQKVKTHRPKFQCNLNSLPTFYRGNMYISDGFQDEVYIKLYVNNDWSYLPFKLKHTDVASLKKHMLNAVEISAPTLEHKNHKWFLRFAFKYDMPLPELPEVSDRRILAVDLGINTDAVCSVMGADGTIIERRFTSFPVDKDYISHTLNKIKKIQKRYGNHNISRLWRDVKFHNNELAKKTASAIVGLAVAYDVDVIVFEFLNTKGKKKGSKKQKLSLWKKDSIQRMVTEKSTYEQDKGFPY